MGPHDLCAWPGCGHSRATHCGAVVGSCLGCAVAHTFQEPPAEEDRGPGALLASGILWHPDAPRVEDVRRADMRAIQGIGRWGGHARCPRSGRTYTLAEHQLRVARLLLAWGEPPTVALHGGVHDIHEVAPPHDVEGPLLRGDGPLSTLLREQEHKALVAWRTALGLPVNFGPRVHLADVTLLATERRDLMPPGHDAHFGGLPEPLPEAIEVMRPEQAWAEWCRLFEMLGGRWPS